MPTNVAEEIFNGRKTPRQTETGRLLSGVINCQTSDMSGNALPQSRYNAPGFMLRLHPCNYRGVHATLNNERLVAHNHFTYFDGRVS